MGSRKFFMKSVAGIKKQQCRNQKIGAQGNYFPSLNILFRDYLS